MSEDTTANSVEVEIADSGLPLPRIGPKGGRPPKPGGNTALANQMRELTKMADLPPDQFAVEVRRHTQGLLGLVTAKLYERIDELSPANLSVLYGILRDKDAMPEKVTAQIHNQTNIQINGYKGSLDDLKAQLLGKKPQLKLVSEPIKKSG